MAQFASHTTKPTQNGWPPQGYSAAISLAHIPALQGHSTAISPIQYSHITGTVQPYHRYSAAISLAHIPALQGHSTAISPVQYSHITGTHSCSTGPQYSHIAGTVQPYHRYSAAISLTHIPALLLFGVNFYRDIRIK